MKTHCGEREKLPDEWGASGASAEWRWFECQRSPGHEGNHSDLKGREWTTPMAVDTSGENGAFGAHRKNGCEPVNQEKSVLGSDPSDRDAETDWDDGPEFGEVRIRLDTTAGIYEAALPYEVWEQDQHAAMGRIHRALDVLLGHA